MVYPAFQKHWIPQCFLFPSFYDFLWKKCITIVDVLHIYVFSTKYIDYKAHDNSIRS